MKYEYNKLVRDHVPGMIINDGKVCKISKFSDTEYLSALQEKLIEEAKEVGFATGKDDIRIEVADLMEVAFAILDYHGIERTSMREARTEKMKMRGAFANRVCLLWVSDN